MMAKIILHCILKICKCRFTRVIFGSTCSQFLSNATVNKHIERYDGIDADFDYNNFDFNSIEIFNKEIKSLTNLVTTETQCENIDNVIDVKKFSRFKKLSRVTASCLRFMNNVNNFDFKKHVNKESYVNSSKLNDSKTLWLKVNQRDLLKQGNVKRLENALHLKRDSKGLNCSISQISRAKPLPSDVHK